METKQIQDILKIALRCAGGHPLAQDLAQDAILRVLETLHTYDASRGDFFSWAATIARNEVRGKLRRERYVELPPVGEESASRHTEPQLHVGGISNQRRECILEHCTHTQTPLRALIANEATERALRAIGNLPAEKRAFVEARCLGERNGTAAASVGQTPQWGSRVWRKFREACA